MPPNSSKSIAPPQAEAKSRTGRRLIAATVLIGVAIGGLALVDRFRERPTVVTAPHEPSQALITSPAPESSIAAVSPETAIPPPPPQVVNNVTLVPPPRTTSVTLSPLAVKETTPAEKTARVPGGAYMIQVGVFTSPANAQALQKQLLRAGIEAQLETRVQLGPFRDKRDADKALVRAKKLGINAVLISTR